MRAERWAILLPLLVTSVPAGAQSTDSSSIDDGLRLRRDHKDAEALEVFRRAYAREPSPRTRAQIALAEQALGQWVEAEADLQAALASSDDSWIATRADSLRKALGTIGEHLATVVVTGEPERAEVWIDGVMKGVLPLASTRVPAGPLHIEIRSAGFAAASRDFDLAPGTRLAADFNLATLASPSSSEAPARAVAARASPSAPVRPTASSGTAPHVTDARRTIAWIGVGAAAALSSAAIVAQVIREQQVARYNDDALCSYGTLSRDARCGDHRGQAEAAQEIAKIAFAGAGVLLVGSTALFLSEHWFAPRRGAPTIGIAMTTSTFVVRGAF